MQRPGQLKHQVTIATVAYTKDTAGGSERVFTRQKTVWANIQSMTGREFVAADKIQVQASHTVQLYYDDFPTLDATMWIIYGSRQLDIKYVPMLSPDERPLYLEVLCQEVIGSPVTIQD